MAKKIYDIKPPKVAQKKAVSPEHVKIKKYRPGKVAKEQPVQKIKEKHSISRRPVLIGVAIVIILIAVYLFFKLPKADIIIWPKVDTLSFKQTITADKSASSVDIANAVIPAKYFQASKTNSQDFPATGNADNVGQATGTIIIYNKVDPPESLSFKTGTHFMSDSGKLFVSLQKVVIPAATKSGSKITPGSVQIKIQAVEGGSDYNIAPASFSIPGLKGTSYYYSVYATSTSAMAGGYTGKVKKVTDDDIQGAKDVLTGKTTSDAMSAVKSQISADYVLLDNAILSNVTSASTQTKSGAVADNFTYQATVQASAVAFKKSDIDQFAKNYIISQMPNGKTLLDNTFKNNYSASSVDVSGGKATIDLDCSSGVYQNIDKNSVALSLIGENAGQINNTLNNSLGDQISKVKINFWPFWVVSAPNNQKAINIELKFQ
ncbi:MAG: hypothetical protein NTY81_03630 [Candidatus Staskawiczbacteria bacterium]|nr:hypothetical protein [Candidatus Staskawiczbacteria bacterium]